MTAESEYFQARWKSTWLTKHTYIDIDTGEIIEKKDISNYIITKTKKYARKSKMGCGGIRYSTHECKRNPYKQQELFGNT